MCIFPIFFILFNIAGPQSGSPGRPRDLGLTKTISAIKLSWTNSNSGRGPILGYYIESRRKGTLSFLKFFFLIKFGDGVISYVFLCISSSNS